MMGLYWGYVAFILDSTNLRVCGQQIGRPYNARRDDADFPNGQPGISLLLGLYVAPES